MAEKYLLEKAVRTGSFCWIDAWIDVPQQVIGVVLETKFRLRWWHPLTWLYAFCGTVCTCMGAHVDTNEAAHWALSKCIQARKKVA